MIWLDKESTDGKSCPAAQQMKTLIGVVGPALEAGRTVNEAFIAPRIASLDQFGKHIDSLIKAYCK
jgi:hypothetical protein